MLITVPALVLIIILQAPLTTARHLLFETDNSAENHLLLLRVLREINRLLINSLLLHYLSDLDGVSGEE